MSKLASLWKASRSRLGACSRNILPAVVPSSSSCDVWTAGGGDTLFTS